MLSSGRSPWASGAFWRTRRKEAPGFLVKALQKRGIIEGWPDIFILREAVGRLDMAEEDGNGAVCFR